MNFFRLACHRAARLRPLPTDDKNTIGQVRVEIEKMHGEIECIKRVMKERGLLDEEKDK